MKYCKIVECCSQLLTIMKNLSKLGFEEMLANAVLSFN